MGGWVHMAPGSFHLANEPRATGIALCLCAVLLVMPAYPRSRPRGAAKSPAKTPSPKTALAENAVLLEPLLAAFGETYLVRMAEDEGRRLNEGMTVYFLRRELQALVDMWRATENFAYLQYAKTLVLQAMDQATAHPKPLIWHGEDRGNWPCFCLESVAAETGGHNQLCDFQGSVGFLLVARALSEVDDPSADGIACFVETEIVEKWLYYRPSVTSEQLRSTDSFNAVLAGLNRGRDSREHFACICLDLYELGYRTYAYHQWAERLIDLYLTVRHDLSEPAPDSEGLESFIPDDWGLIPQEDSAGYRWLLIPSYDPDSTVAAIDTSHGNRTAWLATRAYSDGLVDQTVLGGLINTLKYRIWAPEKGLLYFNNYSDGSDVELGALAPGRGGNVWFGWHRLATYDRTLQTLFLALACDLSGGGTHLPDGAQNKTMANAPLCLEAWGTRLLSSTGQPYAFP